MTTAPRNPLKRFVGAWGSWALGATLFVLALPLYESPSSPDVLGRWSGPYAAALALAVLVWIGFLAAALWTCIRRKAPAAKPPAWQVSLGWAVLLFGAAYFLGAVTGTESPGRFTTLNLFGSVAPLPAFLEWLSLMFVALAVFAFVGLSLPKRLQNVGLVVAALLLAATLAEGAARAKAQLFPSVQGFPTNSTRLWRERHVELNSMGFRDAERTREPAPGTTRVLVVGDSYTFGTGADRLRERYTEQLEAALSSGGTRRWEVVNAGVPDTHTLEHLATLERMLDLRPKVVVLLYAFNDLDYLTTITERGWTDGNGLVDQLNPTRVLFQNSYLFQEINVRWRKLTYAADPEAASLDAYASTELLDGHMGDLARFVATAASAGATTRIVPFDNFVELDDRNRARYRRFLERAGAAHLPVCSLETAFAGYEVADLQVNGLDGHGNALAYSLAVAGSVDCIRAAVPD